MKAELISSLKPGSTIKMGDVTYVKISDVSGSGCTRTGLICDIKSGWWGPWYLLVMKDDEVELLEEKK